MNNKDFKLVKKVKYINADGEYTQTEEQVVARYNDKGYLFKNRSDFLKTFLDRPYPETLTWTEQGKLCRLEHELCDEQLLAYRTGNIIRPHTYASLCKILNCNERQMRYFIKRVKEAGVIGEAIINKEKYFLFNPIYKLHGSRVSLTTFIVFQKSLKDELPSWAYDKFLEDYGLQHIDVVVLE